MTSTTACSEGAPLVVLGLGSNKGDGRAILRGAFEALGARLEGARMSSLYLTEPLYVTDQPPFLNAAVAGSFRGGPYDLLAFCQEVEAAFGRDRPNERRRGERTLDVDILLFGDTPVDDPPVLLVPHAGLLERKFALVPLLELLPEARDPRDGRLLADALAGLGDQGIYYAELGTYNRA